ncbi:MAG: cytochrome P450 [Acidimicrobiia bacterium]|nr:cytochrome P450 [Acidimicrobiia bacterium]MXY74994.1 cytochrome P450 [Acidimicrobiia bacterium]MYB77862.1 cytochrome P450 [Acidimicrobiia bacterium]MYD40936.1 cytochrome P450 [Acidimicrobiia bacterium]MYH05293.1 cytochrome P450 [Acidimicrobiia bacterium]
MKSTTSPDLLSEFAKVVVDEADPFPFYTRARRLAPVFWSPRIEGWVASRRSEVAEVLEDESRFAPLMGGPGSSAIHGRVILHMEGREHRRHSGLLSRWIRHRGKLAGELREMTEQITARLLDQLPWDRPAELHQGLNTSLPMDVTATMMGIPDVARFRGWYDAIGKASVTNIRNDPEITRQGVEAREALGEYLAPIIAGKRRRPTHDLLSELCQAEIDGEPLSTELIASTCSLLLAAGVETTSRGLSNLMWVLFSDRDLWEEIRQDRDLVTLACAEILRYLAPAHALVRKAKIDTELAGVGIGAGDKIMVLLASANRDETWFESPDEFQLHRFAESAFRQFTPRADILPFGAGKHHCTGSLLALMEMEVVINRFMDRVRWAEWVNGPPPLTGYSLRSPAEVAVNLIPA